MNFVMTRKEEGRHGMTGLMVSRELFALIRNDLGFFMRSDNDLNHGFFKLFHTDKVLGFACRKKGGFVQEIGKIRHP